MTEKALLKAADPGTNEQKCTA